MNEIIMDILNKYDDYIIINFTNLEQKNRNCINLDIKSGNIISSAAGDFWNKNYPLALVITDSFSSISEKALYSFLNKINFEKIIFFSLRNERHNLDKILEKEKHLLNKYEINTFCFLEEFSYFEKNLALNYRNELLQQENNYIINSLSWKITKPLRTINKIIRFLFSTEYSPIEKLKILIKRVPFLSTPLKRIKEIVNRLEYKILTKSESEQNLKFINSLSSNRNKYLNTNFPFIQTILKNEIDYPILDVSVVTYNNGKWIENFFQSLASQDYPLEKLRLHFVDNSSTDNTYLELENFKEKYNSKFNNIYLYKYKNLGFGAGHNHAINSIKNSKYVLISNIDLEFEKDTITNIVKFAECDSYDEVASWEVMQKPYEHPKYYDPISLETSWSSHACILLNLSAYHKVGGYHHNIFMYGEDVELSYRFRAHGYKIRYVPYAQVRHYTYDEINQIKPLQFAGSTKANMLLRIRYGNKTDKLYGYFLQFALLIRGHSLNNSRKIIFNNIIDIFRIKDKFYKISNSEHYYFPFRGFDYEMQRKGIFFDLLKEIPKNNHFPLVSIVTRTYKNRNNYLRECISSVLNQTYPNIEHIIVEDGGNSMSELITEVKNSYPSYNIKYIPCEKKGRSFIGNKGVLESKGQYCLFLDDDDLIFPDHISILVNGLLKEKEINSKIQASYSLSWEVLTEVDNEGNYTEYEYRANNIFEQTFDRHLLRQYNYIPIQSILFDKELFNTYGGFDEDMDQLEDWNLWFKYSINSDFIFINKTTSLYRTPFSDKIRMNRANKLDQAYQDAKKRQNELLKKYEHR